MRASPLRRRNRYPLGFNPVQRPSERPERLDAYGYVISAECLGATQGPRTAHGKGGRAHPDDHLHERVGRVVLSSGTRTEIRVDPLTTEVSRVEREHESTALDLRSEAYIRTCRTGNTCDGLAHNDGPSRTEQLSPTVPYRHDRTRRRTCTTRARVTTRQLPHSSLTLRRWLPLCTTRPTAYGSTDTCLRRHQIADKDGKYPLSL